MTHVTRVLTMLLAVVVAMSACGTDGESATTEESGTGPIELSRQYIAAYNERDADAMRSLLASEVEFIRPGPEELSGVEAAMARYEEEWSLFETSTVDVVSFIQSEDTVSAEIEATLLVAGEPLVLEGVVIHEWHDGEMTRYRAYLDQPPAR